MPRPQGVHASTSAGLVWCAGRGGEPWAYANLTRAPAEEASWPCGAEDEAAAASLPPSGQADDSTAQGQGAAVAAGEASCASPHMAADSAASPEKLRPDEDEQPGSPCIPARPSPQRQPVAPLRRSPAKEASPAGRQAQLCSSPCSPGGSSSHWGRGAGGGGSGSGGSPARGSASLTSQLTRELEGTRDELLVQADRADRLADRVRRSVGRWACSHCPSAEGHGLPDLLWLELRTAGSLAAGTTAAAPAGTARRCAAWSARNRCSPAHSSKCWEGRR